MNLVLRFNKILILSSLALPLIFILSTGSRKFTFVTSTAVPAAQASAKIKKDVNKNNIGEKKSNCNFFLSTLKWKLTAVTTFNPKKILVTVEDSTRLQSTGNHTVIGMA